MHPLAALLILCLLASPAAAGPAVLDRLTLRHDLLGWEGVGRLDLGSGGFCTGVLIAPNRVLTAAHCLEPARVRGDVRSLRFRAGLSDGAAVAEAGVARAVIHPDYHRARGLTAENIAADVALVELDRPIPAATAAPFRVAAAPDAGARVSVVSYGAGRAEAPSRQAACSVLGRAPGLVALDCAVTHGSSGAPVFDLSVSPARVVSLVSSGGEGRAFGMDLPAAVDTLRHAFATGAGVFPKRDLTPRRIGPGARETEGTGAKFLRPPPAWPVPLTGGKSLLPE